MASDILITEHKSTTDNYRLHCSWVLLLLLCGLTREAPRILPLTLFSGHIRQFHLLMMEVWQAAVTCHGTQDPFYQNLWKAGGRVWGTTPSSPEIPGFRKTELQGRKNEEVEGKGRLWGSRAWGSLHASLVIQTATLGCRGLLTVFSASSLLQFCL